MATRTDSARLDRRSVVAVTSTGPKRATQEMAGHRRGARDGSGRGGPAGQADGGVDVVCDLVVQAWRDGVFGARQVHTYPLSDAARALHDLEARIAGAAIVLLPVRS
jgi:hypothetical protein